MFALHPDVLADDFSEDIFALDLGSLSDYLIAKDLGQPKAELRRVPGVYRDAESFFAASYLTSGLKSLLEDVLGRLVGAEGNRVLRLPDTVRRWQVSYACRPATCRPIACRA